jgi:DNA-binding transcriptional LysR family regulator
VDFKQFQYFIAVAEELHVGNAADRLHIAQPALSQQIRRLEAQLGVELFTREKRRLTLTAAGTVFLEEARLAVQQANTAIDVARRSQNGEVGRVRIGYVDSAMFGASARRMLAQFKSAYPDVELVLHAFNVVDQFRHIRDEHLDAALVRGPLPISQDTIRADLIAQEELLVCVPAGHEVASHAEVAAEDLASERFIMPLDPLGVGLAAQISLIGQRAGFVPKVYQYAEQTALITCLVASGFGVAILPASLSQINLQDVVYRPLRPTALTQLYLLSRVDERRPSVTAFLKSCRTFLGLPGEAWVDLDVGEQTPGARDP